MPPHRLSIFVVLATACRALLAPAVGSLIALTVGSGLVANQAEAQPAPDQLMSVLPTTVPTPPDNPTTPEKVALGKLLFFDRRLSGNNKMSCATCHRPDKAFGDGLSLGKGANENTLTRNTPSLLNIGFNSMFFWDGRAKSLEEQALLPIQAADEMDQDLGELEREMNAVPAYVERFTSVFGTQVTRQGIAEALSAFERTLVVELSPYDRYLRGEKDALSPESKRGMELFFGPAGCARCHQGPLLTDSKFYRLGFSRDKGLGFVTGKPEDNYKFRTPSLRNVARTGPYMHDGSFNTLDDVLFFYLRGVPSPGPTGLSLDIETLQGVSIDETPDLIAFLEALSGAEPKIAVPDLL